MHKRPIIIPFILTSFALVYIYAKIQIEFFVKVILKENEKSLEDIFSLTNTMGNQNA